MLAYRMREGVVNIVSLTDNGDDKKCGIHEINQERSQYGEYHALFCRKLWTDPQQFYMYLQMEPATFDYILNYVSRRPKLKKNWCNFIKNTNNIRETVVGDYQIFSHWI